MNSVLAEILETRKARTLDDKGFVDVHSTISVEEGRLLADLIAKRRPAASLEIGLAFGVSALFICEAMKAASANPRHIVIDPAQNADAYWKGIGLKNLERAGYSGFVEFIEKPSQIALPELVAAGRKIDFAFIDGEHTFDHVLVDFFFVDQLLNIGGVVVLDDAHWPSIRSVARFIATNRHYKVVGSVGSDSDARSRLPRDASPQTLQLDQTMSLQGQCIAFEKTAIDDRQCDHFVSF